MNCYFTLWKLPGFWEYGRDLSPSLSKFLHPKPCRLTADGSEKGDLARSRQIAIFSLTLWSDRYSFLSVLHFCRLIYINQPHAPPGAVDLIRPAPGALAPDMLDFIFQDFYTFYINRSISSLAPLTSLGLTPTPCICFLSDVLLGHLCSEHCNQSIPVRTWFRFRVPPVSFQPSESSAKQRIPSAPSASAEPTCVFWPTPCAFLCTRFPDSLPSRRSLIPGTQKREHIPSAKKLLAEELFSSWLPAQ